MLGLAAAAVLLVLAGVCLFCFAPRFAPRAWLVGYWSTLGGAFFEIAETPRGGVSVTTASGFMGARPGESYPVVVKGCRSVFVRFPSGSLRGRLGLSRRRLVWKKAPAWLRQRVC